MFHSEPREEYLSSHQFVAAFEAFTNGAAATLAQVLVDQKLITTQARTEVDALVRSRLDQRVGTLLCPVA